MRLSNKSTFFLVCLGALFALGTALITTPVAAHDASQILSLRAHTHPLTTNLPALDLNLDDDHSGRCW